MIFAARYIRASGAAGVLGAVLALAGCAPSAPDAPANADQAARAACRQQTEQSFNTRNRADLYRPDYGRDSPLSGQSTPQIDRGLSDRFSYEQDYQDCLRSRGARQTPAVPTASPLPPGPTQSSPAQPPTAQPALANPGSGRPPAARSPVAPAGAPASPSDLTRPPSLTE